MHMAAEMDTGDIIAQCTTAIGPDETAPELTTRLAQLGASLLCQTIDKLSDKTAARTPQDHGNATLAPMLNRELSALCFSKPAQALHDQVRGLLPWPAATTQIQGIRCKIFSTCVESGQAVPGTVLSAGKDGLLIACGEGSALRILELQPDGGKRMKTADFLRGHPVEVGSVL